MKSLFLLIIIMLVSGCATTTTNQLNDFLIEEPKKTEIEYLQEELVACKLAVKECPASVKECNETQRKRVKAGEITQEEADAHGNHFGYCQKMEDDCFDTEIELLVLLSKEEAK